MLILATVTVAAMPGPVYRGVHAAPQLDALMLFGFVAAVFTLACYCSRTYSRSFDFGIGIGAAALAAYGFLQGAWPLGMIMGVVSFVSFAHWRYEYRRGSHRASPEQVARHANVVANQHRLSRIFGASGQN